MYSNFIVSKALRRMEIEDEKETAPFETDDLVTLVFPADIGRSVVKKSKLFLQLIHSTIEIVQKFVA